MNWFLTGRDARKQPLHNNGIAPAGKHAIVVIVLCAYAKLRLAGNEGEQPEPF